VEIDLLTVISFAGLDYRTIGFNVRLIISAGDDAKSKKRHEAKSIDPTRGVVNGAFAT
jgi:hypothetical protein